MVASLRILLIGFSTLMAAIQLLKPRLPTYKFQIQNMAPKLRNGTFKVKLGADVQMENHNFVNIDIYALSFDLFYPDRAGNLNHIGNVHDKEQGKQQQHQITASTQAFDKVTFSRDERAAAITANGDQEVKFPLSPLWELPPRQLFQTTDDVMLQPAGNWGVFSSLAYDMWTNWGRLQVPSSGVIHLKVAKNPVPMTLSILCDNVLDAWSMEIQGVDCDLHGIAVGWLDLSQAVEKLRNVIVNTKTNATDHDARRHSRNITATNISSLVARTKNTRAQSSAVDEDQPKKLDWKDAMPVLTI